MSFAIKTYFCIIHKIEGYLIIYKLSTAKMGLFEYLHQLNESYPNIAYLYATIGYTSQAIMHIAFKQVTKTISPFQALFMRAFCLFTLNVYILRSSNKSPYIQQERLFRLVLKRLMFSTTYAVLILYCVKYLPVSTVSSLSNTGPIFIFFIEAIYYRKPLKMINLAFTVICFTGVVLILQPEFIFNKHQDKMVENFEFLSMLVILAAFCFAMTMIYIHDSAKKLDVIANLHYSYMGHMCMSSMLANFQSPTIIFEQVDLKVVIVFICVVFFGVVAQYMIFASTALKQPSYTMPFGYVAILVGFTADVLYFQVDFNLLMVIGMILTSTGLLSKLFIQDKHRKQSGNENVTKQTLDKQKENEEEEIRISRQKQLQQI